MKMKFSEIKTRNDLADFLCIERKTFTNVLYNKHVESYYNTFEIPKKSGGFRKIHAPTGVLKIIQKRLSNSLYNYHDQICIDNKIKLNISHAFERKRGIISNASIHKNKKFVLNIDLKDFFDSFHFGRVKGYFEKNKYFELPTEVSTVIAQLSCYNGKLPQGAPTSPIITNLICNVLDYKILMLAKKYRLNYTRYADDLTFSTNDKIFLSNYNQFYEAVNNIIVKNGFEINSKKTRLIYKNSCQSVTGLVVNKKVNINHLYYKKVRSMAYHLYKTGKFAIDNKDGKIEQLEGYFSFINEIDRYNNKLEGTANKKFFKFNAREKEFQKFLFYKFFFANEKPVIVTEGKTDIAYIKSALKNLYKQYPELIEKKEDGKFEFKVSFFKRSKRTRFFFNMSLDGADAMKNLYNFFSTYGDKKVYCNYLQYLKNISETKQLNPVIFIFDNELKTKGKPLYTFANAYNLHLCSFERGGMCKLTGDGKLFLITHQLVDGKSESEIEDLFDSKVLAHKINGKSFNRDINYDITKHYGKEIFSKYISSNYNSIDFSAFKPLLDNITKIVKHK